MQLKPLSDDLFDVLKKSGWQSKNYWHTHCGTPHIFLSLFSFLSKNKDSERYTDVYTSLRESLNTYGITGKVFEEVFLKYCPRGEAPEEGSEFAINTDREFNKIKETLNRRAVSELRSMEIEDLILELFADRSFTVALIFSEIVGSEQELDKLYNEVIQKFKVKKALTGIEEFDEMPGLMTNLNKWVKDNPRTVIGMDKNLDKLYMALGCRSINSAMLVGKAGTGKTECVYELAQRINEGKVPEYLRDKIIYSLDLTGLVSGTRFRGDMEERLMNILEIVKKHPEVILMIDEAHALVKTGASSDDGNGVGNMIKPYISRGELQIIGCTTLEEYTKHILSEKALARRFHKIIINEPTKAETMEILRGLLPVQTKYFDRECQEDLLEKIVSLADQYTLDQANPAKSINMLELAFSFTRAFIEKGEKVDVNSVINSISLEYNVYISRNKLEDTRRELFEKLLGQEKPLNQILRDLKLVDMGVVDPDRPLYSVLLAGPSGKLVAPL